MSMFILGVFSWRRRPACIACMQGIEAGVGVDPGMQGVDALHTVSTPGGGECAHVFLMEACISMEVATLEA